MIDSLSPALILICGAVLIPLLKGNIRSIYAISLPVLGLIQLWSMEFGNYGLTSMFGFDMVMTRLDSLSFLFSNIFLLAAILGVIFALHLRPPMELTATSIYAGAAIGAALAGDLISLFLYWELTALASVLLIWAGNNERSFQAGMRYLFVQIGSGVLLMAGTVMLAHQQGAIAFEAMTLSDPATMLIFIAFGFKAAFPLLNNWLIDSYPEASPTGAVVLSSFTTKLAIYALARGFPGTEILLPIGVVMTLVPAIYAVLENDLRRVLAHSLNIQLGFMVVGVGIGTEMALNGAVAHAFAHVFYKALLFMTMGAVLFSTDTVKASELGGLFRKMPLVAICCIIGALSISAMPLTSGFITKSIILSAAIETGHHQIWLGLILASSCAMLYCGLKIPYFAFFGKDCGITPRSIPANMNIAMVAAAAICIAIGVWPGALYNLLPHQGGEYHAFTFGHVISQLQILAFSSLAFFFFLRRGFYPEMQNSITLEFDWVYRRALPVISYMISTLLIVGRSYMLDNLKNWLDQVLTALYRHHGPTGVLARTWPIGSTTMWVAILLGLYLVLYYIGGSG